MRIWDLKYKTFLIWNEFGPLKICLFLNNYTKFRMTDILKICWNLLDLSSYTGRFYKIVECSEILDFIL